jgi:hypothetical protein
MKRLTFLTISFAALMLASCGTTKVAQKQSSDNNQPAQQVKKPESRTSDMGKMAFIQKVSDNAVYAQNISSNITLTLQSGDKDISVDGQIHLRKNEVIRIQAAPLGLIEVGRIELTPDYVLVIDRIHKEYIKADYNQVDFLKDNGLNFYSLQALFWNQLFLPGNDKVTESQLKQYAVNIDEKGNFCPVTLKNGNMDFKWMADKSTGRIDNVNIHYTSNSHGNSTLDWNYSDFNTVGVKSFPTKQVVNFTSTAVKNGKQAKMTIEMNGIDTGSDWESHTNVSSKYKQVSPEEVLKKILNL